MMQQVRCVSFRAAAAAATGRRQRAEWNGACSSHYESKGMEAL